MTTIEQCRTTALGCLPRFHDLEDRTYFNLNFQPVIPIRVSSRVNVIARTIIPIDSVPGPGNTSFSGVGDIQQQLFFTPATPPGHAWQLAYSSVWLLVLAGGAPLVGWLADVLGRS